MEETRRDEDNKTRDNGPNAGRGEWRTLLAIAFLAGLSAALMAVKPPAGLSPAGQRVLAVTVMAIGLWCTDAIPAALTGILVVIVLPLSGGMPGLGEALVGFAEPVAYFLIWAVLSMPASAQQPVLVPVLLLLLAAPIRLLIPNITGFLATTIPIALSIGTATGINPAVCGLAVMIAGDAVLYYPAQSASSLVVYERGHLTAAEIFRFGLWMTLAAYLVVLFVALPYWAAIGEPLRLISRG